MPAATGANTKAAYRGPRLTIPDRPTDLISP